MPVFDADAAAREVAADFQPFVFKWQDDEFALPNLALLTTNEAVELSTAMQAASTPSEESTEAVFQLIDLLDQIAGEDTAGALREMPAAVMARIMIEWQTTGEEAMGEMGKEPSPSSPRNRQERRSKPTSQPRAKTSGSSRSTKSGATSAA